MRLDNYLAKNGYCKSREKAKSLILEGKVSVNNRYILKPSFEIDLKSNELIVLNTERLFVGRAGEKLLNYIEKIGILCEGRYVLDVGSSTGGFAQVLLSKGAAEVTCVDVGSDQLDMELRKDPRIKLFERCDIRNFSSLKKFDLIVCDVSFISLSKILDSLIPLSDQYILLFKPQFEVGKKIKRNKKGVILDKEAVASRMQEFSLELNTKGLKIYDIQKSSLRGKEGNEEFFFHIRKS